MENRSNGMLVIGLVVAIAAVGVALIANYYGSEQGDTTNEGSVAVVEATEATAAATGDADNDGVPDWQEILWRTDPQNPDSDGDGIGDAQEIAQGSNPLATGDEPSDEEYVAPKALTPTEALSRELFASYAEARQDGSINAAETNAAVSTVLDRNVGSEESVPVYTLSNLLIESDVSVDAYDAAMVSALRGLTEVREYELVTFGRVVETENLADLQKLADAAAVYTGVVNTIISMEVPTPLATQHLEVVNGLSGLAHATGLLTTWNGDPLVGLDLVDNFVSAEREFAVRIATLYALINNLK